MKPFSTHPHALYARLTPEQVADDPAMQEAVARLDLTARERPLRRAHRRRRRRQIHRAGAPSWPACPSRAIGRPLYVTDSQLTRANFYHEALCQLGLPPRSHLGDARRQFAPGAAGTRRRGKAPVIVHRRGASARTGHAGGSPLPAQLRRRFAAPSAHLAGRRNCAAR